MVGGSTAFISILGQTYYFYFMHTLIIVIFPQIMLSIFLVLSPNLYFTPNNHIALCFLFLVFFICAKAQQYKKAKWNTIFQHSFGSWQRSVYYQGFLFC